MLRFYGNCCNVLLLRQQLTRITSKQPSDFNGSLVNPMARHFSSCRNLRIGRHIREALSNGDPIVALESTVITHGMPEPENLKLAFKLEQIVRAGGSVPATVGIINGQLVIGMLDDELEFLSNRECCHAMKASTRDIPIAITLKRSAGTTVAGTMSIVCRLTKSASQMSKSKRPIKVFATGGTGGVHKGGESTMDISADLFEFSRSPLGVVSSGFKSFLDTRRSLEYLETIGCTVMSLRNNVNDNHARKSNKKQLFPAFYCNENNESILSPLSLDSIQEAASILYECIEGPSRESDCRGALIAVPIPEEFSLDANYSPKSANGRGSLDKEIRDTIAQIESRPDLQGFEKTPLILKKLNEATGGKSLTANLALLENNARVGSMLAKEYELIANVNYDPYRENNRLLSDRSLSIPVTTTNGQVDRNDKRTPNGPNYQAGPLVIGCTMIDMHVSTSMDAKFRKNEPFSGVTFEGRPHLTVGGVGRNLAVALEFLGCRPKFLTALAKDSLGRFARDNLTQNGLNDNSTKENIPRLITVLPASTTAKPSSCFALVLRDSLTGQCEYVIANLDTINSIEREEIESHSHLISNSPLVVLDANLSNDALATTIRLCHEFRKPVFIEPTDCLAIPRLVECIKGMQHDQVKANWLDSLVCLSPNLIEFQMLNSLIFGEHEQTTSDRKLNIDQIEPMGRRLMQQQLTRLKCLLITMDKDGVLAISRMPLNSEANKLLDINLTDCDSGIGNDALYSTHFAVPDPINQSVSGSGAGDSFAAGFISGMMVYPEFKLEDCIQFGFKSARLALMDEDTIPKSLMSLRTNCNNIRHVST